MAKKKIGRSVVYVAFNATGITRLSSAEHIQRFHTLFEGVSADLVPTHLFFHESRGGARPFDLEETKSLDSWKPLGGAYIELKYKGAIKGWMNVGIGHASPPRKMCTCDSRERDTVICAARRCDRRRIGSRPDLETPCI